MLDPKLNVKLHEEIYGSITKIIFDRYPRIKGAHCASIAYGIIDFISDREAATPSQPQDGQRAAVTQEQVAEMRAKVLEDRTLPSMTFNELIHSQAFKYTLESLADGGNNPKHRRSLVREVREAIKACAEAQRQASVAELYGTEKWIGLDTAMPEPYEEVRILVDGVTRIGRLNHRREYFQLCTFADSCKGQYIASFDRVAGWQPLPTAPSQPQQEAVPAEPSEQEKLLKLLVSQHASSIRRMFCDGVPVGAQLVAAIIPQMEGNSHE